MYLPSFGNREFLPNSLLGTGRAAFPPNQAHPLRDS